MRLIAFVDAVGDLEEIELAGNRDVRHDIDAPDSADGWNGGLCARELLSERRGLKGCLDVGEFALQHDSGEPPIAVDEVVLVPEMPRLPRELGGHRQVDAVFDAVEDELSVHRRA